MRPIPMAGMEVAFQGAPWDHALPPCSKAAIPLLEKNERVVSWVRPVGGAVHEHIPAIQYKSKYYSLSLRMQKVPTAIPKATSHSHTAAPSLMHPSTPPLRAAPWQAMTPSKSRRSTATSASRKGFAMWKSWTASRACASPMSCSARSFGRSRASRSCLSPLQRVCDVSRWG